MKVIPFVMLKGRKDAELFYTASAGAEKIPLTSFNLFRAAAVSGPLQSESRKEITTVLWRKLGEIAGVTELTSVSSQGSASISVQFDLSRDVAEHHVETGAARNTYWNH